MKRSLWVFDLDNTQVTSSLDHHLAWADFIKLMLLTFAHRAPHLLKIVSLIKETTEARVKEKRFSQDDFAWSLVHCYHQICLLAGVLPEPAIEKKCLDLGYGALSIETYRNRGMIPGAEEILAFLPEKGGILVCVTAGDSSLQWAKWEGYNLGRFFPTEKEFIIVPSAKDAVLSNLCAEYPGIPAFMVGDSIKSDMLPAAACGMIPIHIPHPADWDNWDGRGNVEPPPSMIKLGSILEIRERFDELVRATG